jgi:hypothetical protein
MPKVGQPRFLFLTNGIAPPPWSPAFLGRVPEIKPIRALPFYPFPAEFFKKYAKPVRKKRADSTSLLGDGQMAGNRLGLG